MGKVDGTVTLSLTFSGTDKSIVDAHRILQKTGAHVNMLVRENKVVLKGKNINTDELVSDLRKADFSVYVVKIEEDPKPKHTVHLQVCSEKDANKLKSKLKEIKGIDEVSVDTKLNKVTVKGTLGSKDVVEAAAKVVAVKIWEEPKAEPAKIVYTGCPSQVFVYTTKDLHVTYRCP